MHYKIGRRAFLSFTAIGLTGTLAGCLGLGTSAPITYDLTATAAQPVTRRSNRMIIVGEPQAISTYDSERIVVREPGGVLSYLAESQWSDRLPILVQTRMLQSFRDAGVANVGRISDPIAVDVILSTDVRAFELDTTTGAGIARVALGARLVDDRNRAIIASQNFFSDVPVSSLDQRAVVAALNGALDAVLGQIVSWTAARA